MTSDNPHDVQDDQVVDRLISDFSSSEERHLYQSDSLQFLIYEDGDGDGNDDNDNNDDDDGNDDDDDDVLKSIGCDRALIRAALDKSVCSVEKKLSTC